MSKKKSAKQVPLPDINALADKKYAMDKQGAIDTTFANRANQTNPFGSINWNRDPVSGAWTQTEAYNPGQQALYDTQLTSKGTMGKMAGGLLGETDLHMWDAPEMPTVGGYDERAINSIRALQRPEIEARENADRQRRAAMGLSGGERITETSERNLADQASRADMQAILEGGTRGRQDVTQQAALRGQYGDEQNRMLSQVGGMMGAAAPEDMQFGDYYKQGMVDAPDYAGNATNMWKMRQDAENAKAAAKKGGMMGGLGTLAGAGLGFALAGPGGGLKGAQLGASIGGSAGSMFDK